jgi:hypothetical protein
MPISFISGTLNSDNNGISKIETREMKRINFKSLYRFLLLKQYATGLNLSLNRFNPPGNPGQTNIYA